MDVHSLDVAQGYAALIELQPDTYTVESIASRLGESPAYVSGRLRLIQLIAEAKQAFYEAEATTVRELRSWIEREIHLDLTNASFDPQDETLLPKAGACARCPKRTGSNPLLFPEVRQKSI